VNPVHDDYDLLLDRLVRDRSARARAVAWICQEPEVLEVLLFDSDGNPQRVTGADVIDEWIDSTDFERWSER
jgi:hypothetical protein